jgi:hypothetical protein
MTDKRYCHKLGTNGSTVMTTKAAPSSRSAELRVSSRRTQSLCRRLLVAQPSQRAAQHLAKTIAAQLS